MICSIDNEIRIAACPNPFTLERADICVPAGMSVREMLEVAAPRALDMSALVYVDSEQISRDEWETTYPRGGQVVTIRVIPSGGSKSGKNVLRVVLSLAITASAWSLSGPFGKWFGKHLGKGLGKWVGRFAAGAVGIAGVYGVNKLVPIPEPTSAPTEGRVYSITGSNNTANLYGPIPKIYGQMKVFPPLAALPYTEIEGNDQWMRLLFVVGYGELILSDFRLNDEPLENFTCEVSSCSGADDDDTVDLYTNNVQEEPLSILLEYNQWNVRTTKLGHDANEISCDFTFPMGLCDFITDDNGETSRVNESVSLQVEYRPAEQRYLLYDAQSAAFAAGETITGATSGATAVILEDTDWGTEGCLRLWKATTAPVFIDNETITDSQETPGTAVVNGTLGDMWLEYDNEASGPFTVGNTITGGTSGTVGTLRGLQDDGATGKLVIQNADGDYSDGEQITDGTATADVDGNQYTPPWLPNEDPDIENLCPGFAEWTLGGGASYDSGTGEVTLSSEGDYVESPAISITYAPAFDFVAQYYSASASTEYSPDAGYYLTTTYYRRWDWYTETLVPVPNSDGDYSNAGTASYPTSTWSEKTYEGTGGAYVLYVKIKIESKAPYTAASYKIKTPELTTARTFTYSAKTNRTLRKSHRWSVDDAGRYEVRVKRTSAEATDDAIDDVYWTALRAVVYENPIQGISNLAKVALRVKATDQLGGMVDRFSCIASSVLPAYNSGTQTWTDTETANPAWAFCDVLRGSANKNPVTAARLDLDTIEDWADLCSGQSRWFNACIDKRMTVYETLRAIASVGRAGFAIKDGLYSVVLDTFNYTAIQHFTPRNSWDFSGAKTFYEYPHALKIKFVNASEDYLEDEVIVYDDGYDEDTATRFETIELWGVTSAVQAWKAGRYHLAVMRLRPEVMTLSVDVENIVCTRGDLVYVTHDVMMWGEGFARVTALSVNAGISTVTLDHEFTMTGGETYGARFRLATGASYQKLLVNHGSTSNIITINSDISGSVAVGDLVMLGKLNSEAIKCRVQAITPGPELTATLQLVEDNYNIYLADMATIPEHDSNISIPAEDNRVPTTPSIYQVRSDEGVMFVHPDGSAESQIVVDLAPQAWGEIKPYTIQTEYRETDADEDWRKLADISAENLEVPIRPVTDGETYDIRIRYMSYFGRTSAWVETVHTVVGKTSPPPDVAALYYKLPSRLEWPYTKPLDFAGFEVRYNVGNDTTWSIGTKAHDGLLLASYFDIGTFSGGTMTWMVKAVDTSGNYSDTAATLLKDLGDPVEGNVVLTVDLEGDSYPGEQTNCSVDGSNDLVADSEGTLFWKNDDTLFWGADSDLFWDTWYKAMVYTLAVFPNPIDSAANCKLWLDYTVTALKHLKYRKTLPTHSDDYADFDDWYDPNDGTWTIVSNECQVVHDSGGVSNQTREYKTLLTPNVKHYISIKVRSEDVSDASFGVEVWGEYYYWTVNKHTMSVSGDTAVQPGWSDDTDAYWLFEVLTDGTVNWYVDGEYIDSGAVQGWTAGYQDFRMLVRPDAVGPTNNYFDELRIWYPDGDWIVWPGSIETDTDEIYEIRFTHFGGTVQGKITALSTNQDVDDIVEYLDDVTIAASGTVYLPITETYRSVEHVTLTLQDDSGTAVSVKCMDKNPGSSNGPEVETYNASGTRVAGLVDATVRGY